MGGQQLSIDKDPTTGTASFLGHRGKSIVGLGASILLQADRLRVCSVVGSPKACVVAGFRATIDENSEHQVGRRRSEYEEI